MTEQLSHSGRETVGHGSTSSEGTNSTTKEMRVRLHSHSLHTNIGSSFSQYTRTSFDHHVILPFLLYLCVPVVEVP